MFIREGAAGQVLVTSASDLNAAAECEFAFLRKLDVQFGRLSELPVQDDPMRERAAALGNVHEERVLEGLIAKYGAAAAGKTGGVVEIARPASHTLQALEAAAALTARAFAAKAQVVFQATFFDPHIGDIPAKDGGGSAAQIAFVGYADFVVLQADGSYQVQDTKLARRAKVTALLQLAAYAEQMQRGGVPLDARATLILGDGTHSVHQLSDILPVYRVQRRRLHRLLRESYQRTGADGARASAAPIAWLAPGVEFCAKCAVCLDEIARSCDPLLIGGIRRQQRDALVAAGYVSLPAVAAAQTELAAGNMRVSGVSQLVLERLVMQAKLQQQAMQAQPADAPQPPLQLVSTAQLTALPDPDPGDLFFDFEGDPFFSAPSGERVIWGIDYLFGFVDAKEQFTGLWAHDLAEERQALLSFIEFVQRRRQIYPGMHIYHYASYERTHLLSLAMRHGVGEAEIDQLLREQVLVDLYPVVKNSLLIGSSSYSIKKLEPLYMGEHLREPSGITNGAQSVAEYAQATALLQSPVPSERVAGQRLLAEIADYNHYDCLSTLRLCEWLRGLAAKSMGAEKQLSAKQMALAPSPAGAAAAAGAAGKQILDGSKLAAELLLLAKQAASPAAGQALRLAASAIDYHQREDKSFWWEHFARLRDPLDEWADTRDVLLVDAKRSSTLQSGGAKNSAPRLYLRGSLPLGSRLKPDSYMFAVYDFQDSLAPEGLRPCLRVRIVAVHDDGVEIAARGLANFGAAWPLALTPGPPPRAEQQKAAITEWGQALVKAVRAQKPVRDPIYQLLLREAPKLSGDPHLSAPDELAAAQMFGDKQAAICAAVVDSLRRAQFATLAVQGPPGTGKTYLAAQLINYLVTHAGWQIGVVAQSHKVVENLLTQVVQQGLDPKQVAKVPQGGKLSATSEPPVFSVLSANGHAEFLRALRGCGRGGVIGGTAWDFAHPERFARRSLDLLIVEEAGQFALAPTIAAAVAAQRLLLLGDPQQLPQVSQGNHPEPITESALGWLLGDAATMPAEKGYFLAETRRLHPALCEVISQLSYGGKLRSHPSALHRAGLPQIAPGLHCVQLDHHGNSIQSKSEAAAVVQLIQNAQLPATEVIVVAAYNAQVELIKQHLADAQLCGVRVGTVDKFQGQEAQIAIISLATSSAADAPRGLEFVLLANRLNVAISRAQWASYLISSLHLGEGLPRTIAGLQELSAYLRVVEMGQQSV